MDTLDRITQHPDIMGGKPCVRGLRVTVGMVLGQIAAGHSIDDLLADFPYLEREDIDQSLRYAAWRAEEQEIALYLSPKWVESSNSSRSKRCPGQARA